MTYIVLSVNHYSYVPEFDERLIFGGSRKYVDRNIILRKWKFEYYKMVLAF